MVSAEKRNDIWDIVKGLGILFVVAGHGFGGEISKFVNLFHIPLFFFVSGLVFKFNDRSLKSTVRFIEKCLKTLWLPSLLYGTFYVVFHNLFVSIKLYDLGYYSIKQYAIAIIKHIGFLKTEPLESAMWFLTVLFVGRCLLYGVLWISGQFENNLKQKAIVETALIILIFGAGCFFFYKGIDLPGNADNACTLVPFLYAGYKIKKTNIVRRWLILPSLAVMIVLLMHTGETLWMSRNEIVNPVFYIAVSTAGICFTFQLASLIDEWKAGRKAFGYMGRNTMPILCLHLLAFRLVSFVWIKCKGLPISMLSRHPIVESSYFWGGVYTLVGLVVPLIVPVVLSVISRGNEDG